MGATTLCFVYPPIPYFIGSGCYHYKPGEKHLTRHNVGLFVLIVVREGELHIGENDESWALRKNDALILRPDLLHFGTIDCSEETSIDWLHFSTVSAWSEYGDNQPFMESNWELKGEHNLFGIPVNKTGLLCIPKSNHISETAAQIVHDIVAINSDFSALPSWKQQVLFQQLLNEISMDHTEHTYGTPILRIAEQVEQYIRENYRENITNEVLKQALNYHPNYLAKCMRSIYGFTPLEYLNQYRLKQAKRLLLNSQLTISAIAESVGFQLSNFSNAFTKEEGVSPMKFRKMYIRD